MTITANLADGRVLNFPDGTDPQVVQSTVKSMVAQQVQPGTQQQELQAQPLPDIEAYRDTLSPEKQAIFSELEKRGELPDLGEFMKTVPLAGQQPTTERPFNVAALEQEQAPQAGEPQPVKDQTQAGRAFETMQNIGLVYPTLETAAEMATSTYGVPVSGLAGLFALPFGIDASADVMDRVQKMLVYKPQTGAGQELSTSVAYPFTKLEGVAETVSQPIAEEGHPELAAIVHSAIVGAPAVLGARKTLKSGAVDLGAQTKQIIKKNIEKAIRPSVAGKKTRKQAQKYVDDAAVAVEEIVKGQDKMNLVDETGATKPGMPETLDQFSQAVEQTKRNIFEEYDALAREAGAAKESRPLTYPLKKKPGERIVMKDGAPYLEKDMVAIDLNKTANKLNPILSNKVQKKLSPETVAYAESRINALKGDGAFTAIEAQEAIQVLNQTLESSYRNPTPEMQGRAFVDSLIANDLRSQLNKSIEKATGKGYADIKKKYGALKTIEQDIMRRAIVDARKNNKGLIDYSDVVTVGQIVKGMSSVDPATMAAGLTGKGLAARYKYRNDPNKIVKSMFQDVEKLSKAQPKSIAPGVAGIIGAEVAATQEAQ
jgi:hypothetical protein